MLKKLLVKGTIYTLNPDAPRAEAVAIAGRRILAVGTEVELSARLGNDFEVLDVGEGCVLPGFHDSHVHLAQHGFELAQVNLSRTKTKAEGLDLVAQQASTTPEGEWLLGAGFLMGRWGVSELHKRDLDRVAPRHPVLLRSQDHHSAWANSLALERASVTASTDTPQNGEVVKDADGEPTGLLLEKALHLVWDKVPPPSTEKIQAALQRAGNHLASLGITTVHHMAYEPASYWQQIALLASREDYALRVWACINQEDIERAAAIGLATGQGGEFFQIGGAKFFADGALGSLTAHMLRAYKGTDTTGMEVHGYDVLRERFPLAIKAGLVPVTHAIGDAANRAVLDALDETKALWQPLGMRPRVEHVQHLHFDDLKRFAELGVTASMQPYHFRFDARRTRELLGDRLKTTHAWKSLLESGATLAFGSDTPVAEPDIFGSIETALQRTSEEGEVFHGAEAISLDEALAAYTRDAAYAIGWEGRSGKLKEAFDADLVLLSHDPHDALEGLEVTATMKAGRWTFQQT